mmetsp:Transcript_28216/g.21089  ORF Transcript_28216/g.21089 Transcript_28216/m.21089 type:complete len:85 (+) Transcript_28216:83-337(+)
MKDPITKNSITPKKNKILYRNDLSPHEPALSTISKTSTIKTSRFQDDLKTKLAYEWKNIFRGLIQADSDRKGSVTIQTFNKIIH